jgi:hypothetical protein
VRSVICRELYPVCDSEWQLSGTSSVRIRPIDALQSLKLASPKRPFIRAWGLQAAAFTGLCAN